MPKLNKETPITPSKYTRIDTDAGLNDLLENLSVESIIAVDTESDSLYSYFEKVCLVQISTPHDDYLVDPLVFDISPLGEIFANPNLEKIFHAAEYDLMTLRRDFGFTFRNLFDTMIAARILGWPRYGLANILNTRFGVKLNKRFQQYDWGRRPLSRQALDYASLDTHYLIDLRHQLHAELTAKNRLQEAEEAFERGLEARTPIKVFDSADFWQIKGARTLSMRQQALLHTLFIFRDRAARWTDRPPFKIINDMGLVQIAIQQPKSRNELLATKGVGHWFVKQYGQQLLALIKSPQPNPPELPRSSHRPPEAVIRRFELLRRWRNDVAQKRGVEPDVILPNEVLHELARANPKTIESLESLAILGNWQFKEYAAALTKKLRQLK